MGRRVILCIAAAAIGLAYLWALGYAIAFAATQSTPHWWLAHFPGKRHATLAWMLATHTMAISLVCVPVGGLIHWLYRSLSIRVALAVALSIWALVELPSFNEVAKSSGLFLKAMWLADTLQFVVILPTAVWVLRRLTSNIRSSGRAVNKVQESSP